MKKSSVDQLMEQAQVFASAWSLIGGKFDQGNQVTVAGEEKAALREMLENFVEQVEEQADSFLEALQLLQKWHAAKVADLTTLKEGAQEGVTLRIGTSDADDLVITKEVAAGMQLALGVALDFLGKLPFTLTRNSLEQDCEERRG